MPQIHNIDISQAWVVIPVFNNKDTIFSVASKCREQVEHVLVVDDGSTDSDLKKLFAGTDILVLRHQKNMGKGRAIRTAIKYIIDKKATFFITVDADGQYFPEDIKKFLLSLDEETILVGCRDFSAAHIPGKSKFGRKFSNFWLRLETGVELADTQSGFRAYPVKYLKQINLSGAHYDFEVEVLAKAAWAGLKLESIPVSVWYPESEKRVTNFRPVVDNARISLMHMRLLARRLLPVPHKRLIPGKKPYFDSDCLCHPKKFLNKLMREYTSPFGLAAAAFVGIVLAVLPLISIHTVVILYVSDRLHLNKIMAVSIQNLCIPPFVPVACIEIGHYMLHGVWLQEVSMHVIFGQLKERLWEWLLGSLIVAPVMAVVVGIIVFYAASAIHRDKSCPSTETV